MLRYNCAHCGVFDGEAHMCVGKAAEQRRLEATAQHAANQAERRFLQHEDMRRTIEDAYRRADAFRRLEYALSMMDRQGRD